MTAKKAILKIHLWLGLSSGLVVVILGITGCLLAFETEIRSFTEPQQFVKVEDRPYVPPSVLKEEAEKYLDGNKVNGIEYPGKGKAALASFYDAENYKLVALNPYSGKMLKVKNMNRDFFRIVLDGHYYLWLPEKIGQPIVASATLIFLVMLITGLVLWWPKNKAARKQRFSIKWNAKWRRVNYDLHNVLGFYMTWIVIFITITGLVFGFEWFANSFYWITSGGKPLVEEVHPASDTLLAKNIKGNVADELWLSMLQKKNEKESIGVYYPLTNTDPLEVTINHRPGTYYNMDFYHFDQYSGAELPATGTYAGNFKDAKVADKIK
ncbi:MAG: PepSY-associated TM helix domain-containing protein, partial [Bacteroidota bacterium]